MLLDVRQFSKACVICYRVIHMYVLSVVGFSMQQQWLNDVILWQPCAMLQSPSSALNTTSWSGLCCASQHARHGNRVSAEKPWQYIPFVHFNGDDGWVCSGCNSLVNRGDSSSAKKGNISHSNLYLCSIFSVPSYRLWDAQKYVSELVLV